ncbi:MAG: [protein-PII] uridylyltransferase [Pirellulales bacterium]
MSAGPNLRPSVLAAKERLAAGREKLRQQHERGSPGIQVCTRLADLLDGVILDLYQSALDDLGEAGPEGLEADLVLVAHGGYGRRDVAPFSDVDLMILHKDTVADRVAPLARRMVSDLFDAGLDLGSSVRTPEQACQLAMRDATIATSLIESRYLSGSVRLYRRFADRFARDMRWHRRRLLGAIEKARHDERAEYGETVYLLAPSIKRSPGGLRDLHLVRWVGAVAYGSPEFDNLQLAGALSPEDYRALRRAADFLLRLRNEMHFHAGKPQDVLARAEQMRLAELAGYQRTEAQLPVEQFMREYFRHTNQISLISQRFVSSAKPGSAWLKALAPLVTHSVEGDFRVGPQTISATSRGLKVVTRDLAQILRLVDLANLYNKHIDHDTWEAVRKAAPKIPAEVTVEVANRFLSILSQPARLYELLKGLHEAEILEKILPDFAHARCLLQFNEYHKYTVDEHSLRAMQEVSSFATNTGALGQAYRSIKQKRTLHLALLIHDLGKGYEEDHSEVGLRVAGELTSRLRLPPHEAEVVKFLVHKHLRLSHLAFRRDTSDEQLVVRFAVEVGSPEVLTMLYVLTAADIAAVGPGTLNEWKLELITDLYHRTMEHLAGDTEAIDSPVRVEKRRGEIRGCLATEADVRWFTEQIDAIPTGVLYHSSPQSLASALRSLHDLQRGEVTAWARYLPEIRAVEFTVGTYEDTTPGIFHKLTGALSSQGLQILSAEINTLAEGLVMDRFCVTDPDYAEQPPADRIDQVNRVLVESLRNQSGQPPTFRQVWTRISHREHDALRSARLPTRIRLDNTTSDGYTIIDVFAHDQRGLLYTIARQLFEQGLSVSLAKIGTHLDQVVDVFYVTDMAGGKVRDEGRLEEIKRKLLETIEALQESEQPARPA